MIQEEFLKRITEILKSDESIIGLAVVGSWLSNEIDEFSDLDLILVTKSEISVDKNKMLEYANGLGQLLIGSTGEHVGEPRVLICLYDNPLLRVDIKFMILEEIVGFIERPKILLDSNGQLDNAFSKSVRNPQYPDYQWIEDRFWIWIHYALLKIGRGEYVEAFDFFSFLRMVVFGPLLHIKNNNLPYGVRKVETKLSENDFADLKLTMPSYDRQLLFNSLRKAVMLYQRLRNSLFGHHIIWHVQTEQKVMMYFDEVERKKEK